MKWANLLEAEWPRWVTAIERRGAKLRIEAVAPVPGGVPTATWHLAIEEVAGVLRVSEVKPDSRLPAFCPELHINPDGSFCLHLGAVRARSALEAQLFWSCLEQFLVNQEFAASIKRWPPGRWLSHGDAAGHQLKAEEHAAVAGWSGEYEQWLEWRQGWLGLPRLSKGGDKVVNARGPCPRGCRNNRGKPKVRRTCPRRDHLEGMVLAEAARRKAENAFFADLRKEGHTCCGRVVGCLLQVPQPARKESLSDGDEGQDPRNSGSPRHLMDRSRRNMAA